MAARSIERHWQLESPQLESPQTRDTLGEHVQNLIVAAWKDIAAKDTARREAAAAITGNAELTAAAKQKRLEALETKDPQLDAEQLKRATAVMTAIEDELRPLENAADLRWQKAPGGIGWVRQSEPTLVDEARRREIRDVLRQRPPGEVRQLYRQHAMAPDGTGDQELLAAIEEAPPAVALIDPATRQAVREWRQEHGHYAERIAQLRAAKQVAARLVDVVERAALSTDELALRRRLQGTPTSG